MIIENFDPSFDLQTLEPQKSYELKGFHFSCGDLAIKHRLKICDILRFRKSEVNRIQHLLKEAKKKYDVLLGVHIRQKDFKIFYNGKFYLKVDQYLQSVEHFKSLHLPSQKVGVVICSDDSAAIQSIENEHPDYFYPKGNIAQDIYALSQCDYNIGPMATTMSSWASYLGESLHFQIHKQIDSFELADFQKIKRLEPFNPFLN